jgi:hypothetical protein
LRRSILACGLAFTILGLFTTSALPATRSASHRAARQRAVTFYSNEIRKLRTETWHWQRVMGLRPARVLSRSLGSTSIKRLQHLDAVWKRREKAAYHRATHPPHLRQLMCIHHFEGSWHDSGAPYWGGLQMSLTFQAHYGWWLYRTKGTADHWTPLEQLWTAERALPTRGFYPWPNTARFCGLI